MHTTQHCADRVDGEVYRERGGDDDRHNYGVEFRQFVLKDGGAGGEEE